MLRYKSTLAAIAMLLASASLYGCVGPTMTAGSARPRFCNSMSTGCLALKAQQFKTGTIAAQQARCCG